MRGRSLPGDIDLAVMLRQVAALTCGLPLITAGHQGTDEYDSPFSLLLFLFFVLHSNSVLGLGNQMAATTSI